MKRVAIIGSAAAMVVALGTVGLGLSASARQLDTAFQTSTRTVDDSARSQQRIDDLDTQTQSLLNDYRANLKQLEQLKRYNASQRRQVAAQEREIGIIQTDIDRISGLQRSVQPHMDDMLATLEEFVNADLPFSLTERLERVARLKRVMEDPSQSPAQKYRLIIEAYQIENEYGRTMTSYDGPVEDGDASLENVTYLQIGRVALVYKTADDNTLRIFSKSTGQWEDLNKSFLPAIKTGIRMANESIPPNLLPIPVSAPESAVGQ